MFIFYIILVAIAGAIDGYATIGLGDGLPPDHPPAVLSDRLY